MSTPVASLVFSRFSLQEEFPALSLAWRAAAPGGSFSRKETLNAAVRSRLPVIRRYLDRWRRGALL